MNQSPPVAQLSSSSVRLRPINEGDLSPLYFVATELSFTWIRVGRHGLVPPPAFPEVLWSDVLVQYIVESPSAGPVALVAVYDHDHRSGHAQLEVVRFDTEDAQAALVNEGVALFVEHVFSVWAFRKLYVEHVACTPGPFAFLDDLPVEEARLTSHTLFEGHHWDRVTHAIYLDDWRARSTVERG